MSFFWFFFFYYLERVYEEHELLVDNLMLWTRDSKNRLLFVERPERTLIFENPSLFNTNQQSLSHATNNFAQVSKLHNKFS
jgi:amyloid beta A4 precursor protein-binding family B protein 1-interacting protein